MKTFLTILILFVGSTLYGQKTHLVKNGGFTHIITVNDTTNKIESIRINNSEWINRKDIVAGRFIEQSAKNKYISLLFASLSVGSAILVANGYNQAEPVEYGYGGTVLIPITFLGFSMGFHISSIRKQEIGGKLIRGHWRYREVSKKKRIKRSWGQQGEHPNPLF